MGRYYSGDIEGKFWFAVQNSDAADRFGVIGLEPQELYYCFLKEDLPDIEEELNLIKKTIGEDNIARLDAFFDSHNGYNDKKLEAEGLLDIWNKHQKDYADLLLGVQIRDCIKANGGCEFTAEL